MSLFIINEDCVSIYRIGLIKDKNLKELIYLIREENLEKVKKLINKFPEYLRMKFLGGHLPINDTIFEYIIRSLNRTYTENKFEIIKEFINKDPLAFKELLLLNKPIYNSLIFQLFTLKIQCFNLIKFIYNLYKDQITEFLNIKYEGNIYIGSVFESLFKGIKINLKIIWLIINLRINSDSLKSIETITFVETYKKVIYLSFSKKINKLPREIIKIIGNKLFSYESLIRIYIPIPNSSFFALTLVHNFMI